MSTLLDASAEIPPDYILQSPIHLPQPTPIVSSHSVRNKLVVTIKTSIGTFPCSVLTKFLLHGELGVHLLSCFVHNICSIILITLLHRFLCNCFILSGADKLIVIAVNMYQRYELP